MQLSDGTYNESLLVAMDNFVAEASTRGLRLILALANNWNYNSNMSDTKCAAQPPLPCPAVQVVQLVLRAEGYSPLPFQQPCAALPLSDTRCCSSIM